jgi:beta-alanine degradation protein BauB
MTTAKKSMDPLVVAANVSTLIMENKQVRVIDGHFTPGVKTALHSHPNHIIYVLKGGKMKITMPDGKSTNVDLKNGQAIWMDAGEHIAENLGKEDIHIVVTELKK